MEVIFQPGCGELASNTNMTIIPLNTKSQFTFIKDAQKYIQSSIVLPFDHKAVFMSGNKFNDSVVAWVDNIHTTCIQDILAIQPDGKLFTIQDAKTMIIYRNPPQNKGVGIYKNNELTGVSTWYGNRDYVSDITFHTDASVWISRNYYMMTFTRPDQKGTSSILTGPYITNLSNVRSFFVSITLPMIFYECGFSKTLMIANQSNNIAYPSMASIKVPVHGTIRIYRESEFKGMRNDVLVDEPCLDKIIWLNQVKSYRFIPKGAPDPDIMDDNNTTNTNNINNTNKNNSHAIEVKLLNDETNKVPTDLFKNANTPSNTTSSNSTNNPQPNTSSGLTYLPVNIDHCKDCKISPEGYWLIGCRCKNFLDQDIYNPFFEIGNCNKQSDLKVNPMGKLFC